MGRTEDFDVTWLQKFDPGKFENKLFLRICDMGDTEYIAENCRCDSELLGLITVQL